MRIAHRNAANREDAAEAVQFAALAFLEKFDPDSGAPPLAWATLVVKRECWTKAKRQRLDRSAGQETITDSDRPGFCLTDIPSEGPGTEEAIERAEYVLESRERLAALKAAERRTPVLIAAGYSYAEIGQITGFSYTKVNRCIAEGRAALRRDTQL